MAEAPARPAVCAGPSDHAQPLPGLAEAAGARGPRFPALPALLCAWHVPNSTRHFSLCTGIAVTGSPTGNICLHFSFSFTSEGFLSDEKGTQARFQHVTSWKNKLWILHKRFQQTSLCVQTCDLDLSH